MKKMVEKFSLLLLRGHRYLNRHFVEKNAVKPRQLSYSPVAGLPKIFHINANFVIGGTSQLIADIVEKTSDKYSHQVIVPSYPRPLPYQPLSIKEFSFLDLPALFKYLEKERPAIVHIQYWIRPMHRYYSFGLWYAAIFKMCEELGLKVIQNVNVPTRPFKSSSVLHNVFVSEYVRKEFNDETQVPSSVIYPGSDAAHFSVDQGLRVPEKTIGMVYRLDQDKLEENTIEIFIKALQKDASLFCYIIGGGFYLEYFRKRVREEGLVKRFEFTGFVSYDQLPVYYKKIGLFVAPVHDESFGQVTPFAMSMGLPVVGYDTGALSEILGGKKALVPYGDISGLADLIVETASDAERKAKWGSENKERMKDRFSIENMIAGYTNLYDNILVTHGSI